MQLVAQVFGYRLSMRPEQSFKVDQSVKVYKGLIAKIMVKLNLAFTQKFIDLGGHAITVAVNRRSLGHFIWRHNRYSDAEKQYDSGMKALYKVSHRFWNREYKSFTDEICFQMRGWNLFNAPMSCNDFLKVVKEQAPLKGSFYKIKKDDRTVGYLLGTMHVGNELFLNLNPKINKALCKSQIVAGEQRIDDMSLQIKIKPELKKKCRRFSKVLDESCRQSGMKIPMGIEKCILKKIREMGQPKEFTALETIEETENDINLIFEHFNMKEKPNGKGFYRSFSRILAGNEESAIKDVKKMMGPYKDNLIRRNRAMVDRSEPFLQRERTFIAVGNLHLHGEHGMKALLEQKGYSLKRI